MLKVSHVAILKPVDFQPEFEPPIPLERVWLIYSLEDDAEYAAHEIAKRGYPEKCQEYRRARKAFSGLGARKGLLESFDNVDRLPNEYKRWAGSSWKDILGAGYQSKMYLLMEELKNRLAEDPGPYYLDKNALIHEKELQPPRPTKAQRTRKPRNPKLLNEPAQEPSMLHINIAEREKNEPLEPGEPALEPEGNKLMTEKEIPIPILNPVTTQFDEIVIEAAVATPTKQSHFIFHKRTYNLFHLIFVVAIIIFATLIAITQSQPEKEEQTTERILRIFDKSPRRALDELKELNITALDFGLTLTEAKHKKALYWYKQMAEIDPENEATYLFGTAWNYFHYFQPEEAKKTLVLARGLAEKSKNKKLFAKCTQLLADIYYSQGNLELAYQHSHNALAIFRDLKLFGASSNCLFQLFDFHIKANDIEGAEKTLDQYEKENSLRKNPSDGLSRLYYGKANILMHRTKYPEAIVIFRKSHNLAHEREINYKLRISILIGLCQALKGDLKTAMQQAKSNDDFMSQYPDSNYLQYANDLIWLVIYKCSGHWDIDLEKKIAIWARENDASGVTLNTLQFVKNAPCP